MDLRSLASLGVTTSEHEVARIAEQARVISETFLDLCFSKDDRLRDNRLRDNGGTLIM
jgi:hypothetical protein